MRVRRRVSHVVSNQRLLCLDDVPLDPPVVEPPLPGDIDTLNMHDVKASDWTRGFESHHELLRIPFMPP